MPAHTQFDGDTLFALSAATPDAQTADLTYVWVVAADLVAEAIRSRGTEAETRTKNQTKQQLALRSGSRFLPYPIGICTSVTYASSSCASPLLR